MTNKTTFIQSLDEFLQNTTSSKPHAVFWRAATKAVMKKGVKYVKKALQIYAILS